MSYKRRNKPDPDGIITARLSGTAARYAGMRPYDPEAGIRPLHVDAAVAELREIAGGRADLLAHAAGIQLGARAYRDMSPSWPRSALEAALLIAAGADLTLLEQWVRVGLQNAARPAAGHGY